MILEKSSFFSQCLALSLKAPSSAKTDTLAIKVRAESPPLPKRRQKIEPIVEPRALPETPRIPPLKPSEQLRSLLKEVAPHLAPATRSIDVDLLIVVLTEDPTLLQELQNGARKFANQGKRVKILKGNSLEKGDRWGALLETSDIGWLLITAGVSNFPNLLRYFCHEHRSAQPRIKIVDLQTSWETLWGSLLTNPS